MAERVFQWTYRGRPASMHPNYVTELEAVQRGERVVRLSVGERVVIRSSNEYDGRTGVIENVGRTRYHVRLPEGLVTVLFAAAHPVTKTQPTRGADVPAKETQVSMSLLLRDGRIHVQSPDGDVVELLVRDAAELRRVLVGASLPAWPSADEPRLLRYQAHVIGSREQLALRPMTSFDMPEDASEFTVLTCRSEWGDGDWVDVDEYIGALFRAADQGDCHLLLQSMDLSLNVRLECREDLVFVVADKEITAHEVWRSAVPRGGRYVLQGSLTDSAYDTAGQLAMIAFGSNGVNPLQVYPSLCRKPTGDTRLG